MRLVISAPTDNPLVWSVTKIENAQPIGIQKLTLYQSAWNEHTDKIIREDRTNKILAMYANYYDSNIEPINPNEPDEPIIKPLKEYGKITTSSSTIKVGGSYKNLTINIFDDNGKDVTDKYSDSEFIWSCKVQDVSDDEMVILSDKIIWTNGSKFNQKKIKFPDDRKYLGKIINIECMVNGITITAQFELIN